MISLLLPELKIERFCYSPYRIGLTAFVLAVLLSLLFRDKTFLAGASLIILTIPVFTYLLNGGLYIRDKVMIPFLPLLCYLTAYYLESLKRKRISQIDILPYIVTLALIYISVLRMRKKQKSVSVNFREVQSRVCVLLVPVILFQAGFGAMSNSGEDKMVSREFYEEVSDEELESVISKVTESADGFYRVEQTGTVEENAANLNRIWNMGQYVSSFYSSSYNDEYLKFRQKIFQTEQPFQNFLMQSVSQNPVYQEFMGVKYLVSKEEIPGYELDKKIGKWRIYKNEDALPATYATERLMPESEYQKLEFPYNQTVLLDHAVAEWEKKDEDYAADKGETAAEYMRRTAKQFYRLDDVVEETFKKEIDRKEGEMRVQVP